MYAIGVAFSTYFCMYAFRKPFAAGTYTGETFWFLDLKSALVISQVLGYALSKAIGIKVVSEMAPHRRRWALIGFIIWAEAALLLFAVVPQPLKIGALFLNGLPLGMVWGIVFSFLEGRQTTELLGAGLSCSYILASGVVKSAGKFLLNLGVPEMWMPAATGLAFLPVFLVMAYMLSLLPPPNTRDQELRTARRPMNAAQRRQFLRALAPGLALLTILYFFLTAYRDFRDNFAADIWQDLGMGSESAIFALSELPIAFGVMFVLALLYLVKNNRTGLLATHAIMTAGMLCVGLSTLAFDLGLLGGTAWMISIGLGLYLAYVPFGCVLFDRMIATLGVVATAVFMIYVTDAVGYVGSVAVVLYKNLGASSQSMLGFFRGFSYVVALLCGLCFVGSWIYFARRRSSGSIASRRQSARR